MDTKMTPPEYAQRVVDGYTRGIICSGEVWNQIVDHATTLETLHEFMTRLTPELHTYLQREVLVYTCVRSEHERMLLQWIREWYETRGA